MKRRFDSIMETPFCLFRALYRLLRFSATLVRAASLGPSRNGPACWLGETARKALAALNIQVTCHGAPPNAGLLVCNHISYLDIPALASVSPMTFVSKAEVQRWPVFGMFARRGQTIFVRRDSKRDVEPVTRRIAEQLEGGHVVCLFPEGTSSDGRQVLPFKSSLLQPAVGLDVYAAHITYHAGRHDVGQRVAYWGDMTFLWHFLRVLTIPQIHCRITFAPHPVRHASRKELSQELHEVVRRLADSAEIENGAQSVTRFAAPRATDLPSDRPSIARAHPDTAPAQA